MQDQQQRLTFANKDNRREDPKWRYYERSGSTDDNPSKYTADKPCIGAKIDYLELSSYNALIGFAHLLPVYFTTFDVVSGALMTRQMHWTVSSYHTSRSN